LKSCLQNQNHERGGGNSRFYFWLAGTGGDIWRRRREAAWIEAGSAGFPGVNPRISGGGLLGPGGTGNLGGEGERKWAWTTRLPRILGALGVSAGREEAGGERLFPSGSGPGRRGREPDGGTMFAQIIREALFSHGEVGPAKRPRSRRRGGNIALLGVELMGGGILPRPFGGAWPPGRCFGFRRSAAP